MPLLMITDGSAEHLDDELYWRALRMGVLDFLATPFSTLQVHGRVRALLDERWRLLQEEGQAAWLEEKVRERAHELEASPLDLKESQVEIIVRLALAAELHDPETSTHTHRVGMSAALLAQALGLCEREVEMIRRAAPLHDVGKIGIADPILHKPGKLSDEEWQEMKTHCRIGAQILACGDADLVQVAQTTALFHHERWDGSGYPLGLRGEEIPLEARILAVADVFDALTHERPYKAAWPIGEALAEIERVSGSHFDPAIVVAFRDLPHEELL